jgi:FtsP/CotA-like multicopper oxidase with cupredoxin domain
MTRFSPHTMRTLCVAVAFFAPACGDSWMHDARSSDVRPADVPFETQPWSLPSHGESFDSELARDDNAAEDVVEVALEAREADVELIAGQASRLWTYNGVLPGPRIEAKVGDRLIVHLTNSLPEATTIHWHGLRVPASMDGAPMVQRPIEPGETFTYDFIVPDAGLFWYHPHHRSNEQVERGLYGTIVVRGPEEPRTTSDHVVVLDDVLLEADGQLAPFDTMGMQTMAGRQGNVILANGHTKPVIELARGGLHRFRFVNTANARYFRLALEGRTLIVIGSDGGLLEAPREVRDFLLVPGQRVDLLVRTDSDGVLRFQSLPYNRGHQAGTSTAFTLFELQPSGQASESLGVPTSLAEVPKLPAPSVRRTLELDESMMGGMGGMGHMGGMGSANGSMPMAGMFSINGESYPDVTPLVAKLGDVEEWSIVNRSMMDHPFHLHGFRFQVVSRQDGQPLVRAWEDTVNVKANQTVTLRMRLEEHPGSWMFHCHILEHAEAGMAGELSVRP